MNPGLPTAVIATALVSFAPSSGAPPSGPMERYEPKVFELKLDCILDKNLQHGRANDTAPSPDLLGGAIVMPVIFESTYSEVDRTSVAGQAYYSSRDSRLVGPPAEIRDGGPYLSHYIEVGVSRSHSRHMRWTMEYRTRVYAARIDDAAAARLTWPRDWPESVRAALKPEPFIESDDPIFAKAVEDVTKGNLRNVPPYLAAKELVRYCLLNFQANDSGTRRRDDEALIGMVVNGASSSAREGKGTAHDLLCVCVATLRAAGIPARPVVGVQKAPAGVYEEFVSWGEFYLVGAGWIPFDPYQMDGKGERTWQVNDPWPEFGTMNDLNERIPLAFAFKPANFRSPNVATVWGWRLRAEADFEQDVMPSMQFSMSASKTGE